MGGQRFSMFGCKEEELVNVNGELRDRIMMRAPVCRKPDR